MWFQVPDSSYVIAGCVDNTVWLIIWVVWESYFINTMRCLIQKKHEAAHLVPRSLFWGFILRPLQLFLSFLLLMIFQCSCVGHKKQKYTKTFSLKFTIVWPLLSDICSTSKSAESNFRADSNQLACWDSSAGTSIDHGKLHLLTKHTLIFVFKPSPKKSLFLLKSKLYKKRR